MKSKLKKMMLGLTAIAALMGEGICYATDVLGVGATFPAPLYAKWADAYKAKSGVKIEYLSLIHI